MGGGGGPRPSDWLVPPMARASNPGDPENEWYAARRLAHPRGCFEEPVHLSKPLENRPFSLTYIVATGRTENEALFDRTAARLRGNPRWTLREIDGGHVMTRTNPKGLAQLFLELFPARASVPAHS